MDTKNIEVVFSEFHSKYRKLEVKQSLHTLLRSHL